MLEGCESHELTPRVFDQSLCVISELVHAVGIQIITLKPDLLFYIHLNPKYNNKNPKWKVSLQIFQSCLQSSTVCVHSIHIVHRQKTLKNCFIYLKSCVIHLHMCQTSLALLSFRLNMQ